MLQKETKETLALAGGITASIVTAMMGIAVYAAANPGIFGWLSGIAIFLAIESISVLAAITIFAKKEDGEHTPTLLTYFAILMLTSCIGAEIFVTASKMQQGILKKVESAKYADSSNNQIKQLQDQLNACPKNHYTNCRKPIIAAIESTRASTGFNADSAAEKSKWEAVADWYNTGKLPEDHIKPEQAAFWIWLALGAVIAIGKVFLYAVWGASSARNKSLPNNDYRYAPPNKPYSSNSVSARATSAASERWGNVAVISSQQPLSETVPTQLNQPIDAEQSYLEDVYMRLRRQVAKGGVRPTVRPVVDYLMQEGVGGTSEHRREIAGGFLERMVEDGTIRPVEGRTARHPQGQYEPTGKFK